MKVRKKVVLALIVAALLPMMTFTVFAQDNPNIPPICNKVIDVLRVCATEMKQTALQNGDATNAAQMDNTLKTLDQQQNVLIPDGVKKDGSEKAGQWCLGTYRGNTMNVAVSVIMAIKQANGDATGCMKGLDSLR